MKALHGLSFRLRPGKSAAQIARRAALGNILLIGIAILTCASAVPAKAAPADPQFHANRADLLESFRLVVFDAEYAASGARAGIARKFDRPVAIAVVNTASVDRSEAAAAFVRRLAASVPEARLRLAGGGRPDVVLHLVDRRQYAAKVAEIFGHAVEHAPGRCLAWVHSRGGRIQRSDAIIVVDEGDYVFGRCLAEETLQTLGPLADRSALPDSVFNNQSHVAELTGTDVLLLRMLYHRDIRPGMSWRQAEPRAAGVLDSLLPAPTPQP